MVLKQLIQRVHLVRMRNIELVRLSGRTSEIVQLESHAH